MSVPLDEAYQEVQKDEGRDLGAGLRLAQRPTLRASALRAARGADEAHHNAAHVLMTKTAITMIARIIRIGPMPLDSAEVTPPIAEPAALPAATVP